MYAYHLLNIMLQLLDLLFLSSVLCISSAIAAAICPVNGNAVCVCACTVHVCVVFMYVHGRVVCAYVYECVCVFVCACVRACGGQVIGNCISCFRQLQC